MAYPVLHVIERVVALRLVALLLKRLPLGERPVSLIMHGVSLGRGFVRSLFPLFECVLRLSKHSRRVLLLVSALCCSSPQRCPRSNSSIEVLDGLGCSRSKIPRLPRCHASRVSFV